MGTSGLVAFLATLIVVIPFGMVTLIGSRNTKAVAGAAIAVGAFWFIVNWLVFYFDLPTIGFTGVTFWRADFWLFLFEAITALAVCGFVAYMDDDSPASGTFIGAIVLVVLLCVHMFAGVWSDGRAKELAHQLKVTNAETGAYPDTSTDHMVLLSPDMADFKAQQAMNQAMSVTTGGFKGNVSTLFDLGGAVLESVDNHAYYLFALKPTGWRNSNSADGIVPGYMQVDAENPDAPAQLVTKDKAGHDLNLKYYPDGYFGHNLMRHIWTGGYHGQVINDPTLEVDDNGHPYFTASVDQMPIATYPTVPKALLIVDAVTGNIQQVSLDKIPDWVDRVYGQGTIENLVDWWGEWNGAGYNMFSESSANRYKIPDDEDPVIVYTTGGHPKFQAIYTSWNKDTSAAGVMMVDARDNRAESYQIPGLTLEKVATGTITGAGVNLKHLRPAHMSLHKIYGVLTWVSPVESGDNHAYQGLALIRADDVNGSSVVVESTKAAALDKYRQKLAEGAGSNSGPAASANEKDTEGTVAQVSTTVEGGNTAVYFILAEDPEHQYRGTPNDDNPELRFIKSGAKVRVKYFDTGGQRRDVSVYNDLSLQLTK